MATWSAGKLQKTAVVSAEVAGGFGQVVNNL
jgi:hypothetical protein